MALKPMKYRKADLSVGDILAGQEVPGFEAWDHWTQKALMEQKMVRWSENGELAPHEKAAAERIVYQPLPGGPLAPLEKEAALVRDPAMFKDALPEIKAAVVDSTSVEVDAAEVLFKPAVAPTLDPRIVVDLDPGQGSFDCSSCGKTGFKDANGLRIHQARVHKDIV